MTEPEPTTAQMLDLRSKLCYSPGAIANPRDLHIGEGYYLVQVTPDRGLVLIQSGVLVERAGGTSNFSHYTLQVDGEKSTRRGTASQLRFYPSGQASVVLLRSLEGVGLNADDRSDAAKQAAATRAATPSTSDQPA